MVGSVSPGGATDSSFTSSVSRGLGKAKRAS